MRQRKDALRRIASRHFAAVGLAWISLVGIPPADAQVADSKEKLATPTRLLTVEEGRSIVTAAWGEQSSSTPEAQDCSHLVHQIYLHAGFEYPYVSSTEMYAGNESFARVKVPHAGDLIVWPGHMGIVVDPSKHSFYSLVSTGLEEQDYEVPYWRSRGRRRFYRYRMQNPTVLSTTKTSSSSPISTKEVRHTSTIPEQRSSQAVSTSNRSKGASDPTAFIYGPPIPRELANATLAPEIPSSIRVGLGSKAPTREDVAKGISTLNEMSGEVLRSDDLFKIQPPVVIVDQFSVERLEIKRDHSWAQLRIDSRVCVGCGSSQSNGSRERVRWELRHTDSGWELVTPSNRTYVSHDVAVRNLAAQLALLTESDGAAAHQEAVLQRESQLVDVLRALLDRD